MLRTCLKLSLYVEETDWLNICNLEVFDTIIYTIQFNIPACIFGFMCPKVDISAPLPKGKLSNKIKKGTMVNEGRVHLRFGIPCFGRTGQRKVYTPKSDMGCLALLRVVQQILVETLDISVLLQKGQSSKKIKGVQCNGGDPSAQNLALVRAADQAVE